MGDILEKHGISYDEERHLYARAGFAIPSVTQILPFKCDGPEDVIRKAAERGHRVHKWIELTETNWGAGSCTVLAEDNSDYEYCRAWLKFKEITGFELARLPLKNAPINHAIVDVLTPLVERFIYHPVYNFVGRLDLVGYLRRIPRIENDLTLVDAKTVAKLYPTTALQTSAYMMAINLELKALGLPLVKHRWAAQLKPDGTCRRANYPEHKSDFATFLAYLNVTRWETEHGEASLPDDPFTAPAQREPEEVMARL